MGTEDEDVGSAAPTLPPRPINPPNTTARSSENNGWWHQIATPLLLQSVINNTSVRIFALEHKKAGCWILT